MRCDIARTVSCLKKPMIEKHFQVHNNFSVILQIIKISKTNYNMLKRYIRLGTGFNADFSIRYFRVGNCVMYFYALF